MKIISNFKDYYDFVAGHDTDPRKVFVRNIKIFKHKDEEPFYAHKIILDRREWFQGAVLLCDKQYNYLFDMKNNIYYYTIADLPKVLQETILLKNFRNRKGYAAEGRKNLFYKNNIGWLLPDREKAFLWYRGKNFPMYGEVGSKLVEGMKNYNTKNKAPIVYCRVRDGLFTEWVYNGSLNDIQFNKVMSPSEAFTEIYNWLPYQEPEVPSDPVDMVRFEGKGFDKKISFRNVK